LSDSLCFKPRWGLFCSFNFQSYRHGRAASPAAVQAIFQNFTLVSVGWQTSIEEHPSSKSCQYYTRNRPLFSRRTSHPGGKNIAWVFQQNHKSRCDPAPTKGGRQRLPTKSGDTSPELVEGASLRVGGPGNRLTPSPSPIRWARVAPVSLPSPADTSSGLRPPSPHPMRRRAARRRGKAERRALKGEAIRQRGTIHRLPSRTLHHPPPPSTILHHPPGPSTTYRRLPPPTAQPATTYRTATGTIGECRVGRPGFGKKNQPCLTLSNLVCWGFDLV